ncbi:M16 family metallopeptidase [Gryllotalpicola protaetiae]|uniref:Insulinase family protein n=1 Tax=Gryllotalpicola protaetiae TaxID=2419771 RepID=A0A387BR17_9MICO|nr:pitrilysin family protein [Gryllotalpicola protaetiae]AYG04524.1 insulinase family protein [Gryllotalpicola protaetiae]
MNGAVSLPLDAVELAFAASGDALVRRTVLPNGARVLSERVPGARSATVGFWVTVGSRDETGGDEGHSASFGSTHFLEHLLFKGTPSRTALEIAVSFDAVGGEHNAATSKEYTCYYAKVQDKDLSMAVEVIGDMISSSVIDPDEFDNERQVILEELAMADDDPADAASEQLYKAVLGRHPLGRPIGGDPATIRAATRDGVWQHYRATHRPEHLVVAAAGAVDHDRLVADVTAALARGEFPDDAQPAARRPVAPAELGYRSSVVTIQRPVEQVNLFLGVPGLVATDERRSALAVLNAVLGGGMSSRLFQEIREKRGLAYSVYSFAAGFSDAGLFGVYAGCAPHKAPQVVELARDELARLAEFGITGEELRRAVGQLSGATALALEDSDTRMTRLGRAEVGMGEFSDLDESLRRLALVTSAQVRELAAEFAAVQPALAAVGDLDASAFAGLGLG